MDRILLGQLGSNGDCLYATILARQLRADHPDAHITWAISSQCVDVLRNNPHVDEVWEVPIRDWSRQAAMWPVFEREALHRYVLGDFDHVVLSQISPSNFQNYDGTVRPSILRAYGRPVTVPVENVICLTDEEIARVEEFARNERLAEFEHRILFECSSKSGQSFVTPDLAQEVASHLYGILPGATCIFSTHLPMKLSDPRSRYAGHLSLRETAHLTRHCTLFAGAGSGGTVAASSTASSAIDMIVLLKASTSVFASFAHDFEYFGITDRTILEMTDQNPRRIAACIAEACRNGARAAAQEFDSRIPVRFDHYFRSVEDALTARHRYLDAALSLLHTAGRYGWTRELIDYGRLRVAPNLELDPRWVFRPSRSPGEMLRRELADAARHPAAAPRQGRWKDERHV